jgi:hypothetical protein
LRWHTMVIHGNGNGKGTAELDLEKTAVPVTEEA